jgi:hypothetical protein
MKLWIPLDPEESARENMDREAILYPYKSISKRKKWKNGLIQEQVSNNWTYPKVYNRPTRIKVLCRPQVKYPKEGNYDQFCSLEDIYSWYCANVARVPLERLRGKTRDRSIVDVRRHLVQMMYWAGKSYSSIGEYLCRDHSSIMYLVYTNTDIVAFDIELKTTLENIYAKFPYSLSGRPIYQTIKLK